MIIFQKYYVDCRLHDHNEQEHYALHPKLYSRTSEEEAAKVIKDTVQTNGEITPKSREERGSKLSY